MYADGSEGLVYPHYCRGDQAVSRRLPLNHRPQSVPFDSAGSPSGTIPAKAMAMTKSLGMRLRV
jgi:hypothetical protein